MCMSCCFAQDHSYLASTPSHFHWSPRRAVVLRDDINPANFRELTPLERDALIQGMESELRPRMRRYGLDSKEQRRKVARETHVKLIDLDADWVPEVILQADDIQAGCGAANCPLWILKSQRAVTRSGWKRVARMASVASNELTLIRSAQTNIWT